MPKPANKSLLEVRDRIRAGKEAEALRLIKALLNTRKGVDRGDLPSVADLARRAGAPGLGLQLLNPLVRQEGKTEGGASPEEKTEYAACLTYIGAWTEARALLETLDGDSQPRVYLFRAFSLVNQGDYAGAVPLLQKYVRHPSLDDYSRMVGKVNLAEAYVSTNQYRKADPLLQDLLYQSSVRKFRLLLGKALEVSAMSFILQKKLQKAAQFLQKSKDYLTDPEGLVAFFVRKWEAISELHRHPSEKAALDALRAVRKEAIRREHWESARECDYFEAVLLRDKALFLYVYFGTPIEAYRTRLTAEFKDATPVPRFFDWSLMPGAAKTRTIDPSDLKAGQVLHRLLRLLSSDFYRPLSLGTIHAQLYPGEFFNPVSSPQRVRVAFKRLHVWAKSHAFPIKVIPKNGFYRLQATAPCAIRVESASTDLVASFTVAKLREGWNGGLFFSAADAARALSLPARTVLRRLSEAVDQGLLVRVGTGPLVKYRFRAGE